MGPSFNDTPSGNEPLPDQQPGAVRAPGPERTTMNTTSATPADTPDRPAPSREGPSGERHHDRRHHDHGHDHEGPGGHRRFGRHGHGRHHGFGSGRRSGPPWAAGWYQDEADDQRSNEGGPGHRFGGFGGARPGHHHRREAFLRAMARGFGPGGPGGPGFGPGGPGGRRGFGGHGGPGGGRGGPWFGEDGPGRKRGERFFERGELRYVILDLVNDQPRHGYDIIRALEEQFSGLYSPSPGTIYPTLQLQEDQGLVVSEPADGKKVYRATDEGRAVLAERADVIQAIRDRIGARPVFEAIGDIRPIVGELWELGQTVMRAASRGDLADEGRVGRLREAIRRAKAEVDTILTVPSGERPEAKPDRAADEPVVL